MQLSVLVISYNTKKITLQALRSIVTSLKNSDLTYEILVLDNHSQYGSVAAIKKLKIKTLRLFESLENLGFGKGNNYLAKKAHGQHLLLLNSDIEVIDKAIDKLFSFYIKQRRFAFVGGKLLNTDLSPQASCGPLYSPLVVLAALFCRGDYWGLTRYSPSAVRPVGWVSGACILTAKADYEKVNGFDENIFMYMEEIDLFKRAQKIGLKVGYFPNAKFIHHGFASSKGKSRPVINVFKGIVYYYRQHYGWFSRLFIWLLLKTKALLGYTLGVVTNNHYLKQTYYEAYKITGREI